jgi:hypothetical protein
VGARGTTAGIGRPILVLLAAVGLAVGATGAGAQPAEFSEARLFFELNHTDGDLGLHASIDGGPYVELEIEGPDGREILRVTAAGSLARQGLTQLALESAEPPFDELAPVRFFKRFPPGRYEIEGKTRSGQEFTAIAVLSHVLAAPPENITLNGVEAAENCDADLPEVKEPVTIRWDPVTESHPDIGEPGDIGAVRYQLFVEQGESKLSLDLPPGTPTSFKVPAAVTIPGQVKFEIIVRTEAGNNTAVESCFVVVP